MALKDIIQNVRLRLDKRSADQTAEDAKKSLSKVDKGLATLKKAALGVGSALAAAFAVRKVVEFGKELVRVAKEAEAIWNRLSQAVSNVGISFEKVRPEVEAFARVMQDATVVGDEEFAQILTDLITTSGDYARSINNVSVVADLAAAKQIDLSTAAQLVGRAMVGQTATLTRYGIIVKEGEDAVEAIRRSFRGFAQNEAKTLSGRLAQLANEWGDFKEALGEAMIAGSDGTSIIGGLAQAIKHLTAEVNANKETFSAAIRAMVTPIGWLIDAYVLLTKAAATAAEVQTKFMEGLKQVPFFGAHFPPISAEYYERVQALRDYADLLDRVRKGGMGGDPLIQLPPPYVPVTGPPPVRVGEETGASPAGDPEDVAKSLDLWQQYPAVMLDLNKRAHDAADSTALIAAGQERLNSAMEVSAENAAILAANLGTVAQAAEVGTAEMENMALAGEFAASIVAGALGGDLGRIAAWKAQQNAIMAAEKLAEGFVASTNPLTAALAPGLFAAAGKFAAVSAAWAGLAAATGGFGGGGGRGSARASRDVGGAGAASSAGPSPEFHLYLVGEGFDALNPTVQRVVQGAQQTYGERYGPNFKTYIHRKR